MPKTPTDSTPDISVEATASGDGTALPIYSSLDQRLLGWVPQEQVPKLMELGRATLIKDRKAKTRRIYLKVEPGDENDPRVWDLLNRMCEGRKTVYRELILPETHKWIWSHKLKGEALEAYRQVGIDGLIKDGVLKP